MAPGMLTSTFITVPLEMAQPQPNLEDLHGGCRKLNDAPRRQRKRSRRQRKRSRRQRNAPFGGTREGPDENHI